MRILIPVDGSELSNEAVSVAIFLHNYCTVDVTLFHAVASSFRHGNTDRYRVIKHANKSIEIESRVMLEAIREQFPEELSVEVVSIEGQPVHAVPQYISDSDGDLVIMGSRGIGSPLRSIVIGSVTKHALAHVEIPIFVIGREGWKKTMKNILIPIDGSKASMRAVDEGVKLQKLLDADVTLMYVVADPRKEGLVEGTETMLREEDVRVENGQAALAEAKARFPEEADVKTILLKGVVTHTIENAVVDSDYDLMIMGTQGMGSALKRLILGSVTKHVLEHVAIPVLVIR